MNGLKMKFYLANLELLPSSNLLIACEHLKNGEKLPYVAFPCVTSIASQTSKIFGFLNEGIFWKHLHRATCSCYITVRIVHSSEAVTA